MADSSKKIEDLKRQLAVAEGRASDAEAALREAGIRNSVLMESWAQAVWETDAAGVVVRDSPSWRAYTGQTLEEWLGYGWLDAIHPDDRAYAERQWRDAMAARTPVDAEFRLRAREGGWRWTNVLAAPMIDSADHIERWLGLNIDIDDRKRAEDELRLSEKRYRELFTSMDEAYAVVEVLKDNSGNWIDFRFHEVNPAFIEHTSMPWPVGKTATELLGTPNPRWTELYGQALDIQQPIRVEEPELTLNRVFDLNIFPLDTGRNMVAVLFMNITERKRHEAAMRESEERLRLAIDVGALATWDWNIVSGGVVWNDRHYLTQGYQIGEVTPSFEAWLARVHPEDRAETVRLIEAARDARQIYVHEFRTLWPDGTVRWCSARGRFFYGPAGEPRRMIGVMEDATAQKQAEATLRANSERQAFLLKFSDTLRMEPDAEKVAQRALQLLFDHLHLDRCYITYYRLDDDEAVFPYQVGNDKVPPLPGSVRLSDFPDAYAQVKERTFVVDDDFERRGLSEEERAKSQGLGMRAMLASTVRKGGSLPLASMMAVSSDPRHWTSAEIVLVEEIAERTWSAIERVRAEAALRESEERFQQFAAASVDALWVRDAETYAFEYVSPAVETVFGVAPAEVLHDAQLINALIVPEERDTVSAHVTRISGGDTIVQEYRIRRQSDGAFRWIKSTGFPLRNDEGCVRRIGTIASDISEARQATDHQNVLLHELQHRVRNIMGMIRSVANRSAEGAPTVDDYRAALEGRLLAIARVQALLTREANAGGSLREIVESEVRVQAHHPHQFELIGPQIVLSPKAVEVLTLAFHELSTNALKYGAFSVPQGKLVVRWSPFEIAGSPWLRIDWIEEGVPLNSPPTRLGFGSELIEARIPYELGGTGKVTIEAGGAHCRIEFPLRDAESILETDAPMPTATFGGTIDMSGAPDLNGRVVLVVEDDYYVAADTVAALRGAGAEVLGPCPSEDATRDLLESTLPTHAVLDLNLGGGGPKFEIAHKLKAKGVPFVFITGYDPDVIPPELADIPRLQKPVPFRSIVEAVSLL